MCSLLWLGVICSLVYWAGEKANSRIGKAGRSINLNWGLLHSLISTVPLMSTSAQVCLVLTSWLSHGFFCSSLVYVTMSQILSSNPHTWVCCIGSKDFQSQSLSPNPATYKNSRAIRVFPSRVSHLEFCFCLVIAAIWDLIYGLMQN